MDFRGQSSQSTPASPAQPVSRTSGVSSSTSSGQFGNLGKRPVRRIFQIGAVLLLFSVTALVVALTFLLVFGGNSQQRAVQKDKYQAVFLNNGQVYFGSVRSINDKTIDLRGIYYLQTNGGAAAETTTQASSSTNVSLVKLGCELHAPYDQMLINADQVIFWENLQDSSQVVTAITKYKKDNAKQACSTQSQNSTQQAPSTTPTPTPTTPSPTPTTPIKKP